MPKNQEENPIKPTQPEESAPQETPQEAPQEKKKPHKGLFKNERVNFIIGVILIIFSIYLTISFISFLFTGSVDQSKIENLSVGDFTAPRDLSGNGSFSVSVSIPLGGYIPGSQQALASERSRVNLEQAKIALENTRTAAGQEVLSLFNTIQDITETFAINRMNETFAARAYELSRAGFDAGLVSQTDLEIARQDFLSARYTVIAAVTQYRSSLAELAHALNVSEEALWAENTTTGRGNAE